MELLKHKTNQQVLESILAETAKSSNELRCAQGDLAKAQGRLSFAIVALHELLSRQAVK